jgi:hypothetical protein
MTAAVVADTARVLNINRPRPDGRPSLPAERRRELMDTIPLASASPSDILQRSKEEFN